MKWLKRIHLIDKFLLIFMTIFMIQSAYSLFTQGTSPTQDTNAIDVIIRTSAAAIFGYFISANFVRRDSLKDINLSQGLVQTLEKKKGRGIRNQIGFADSNSEPKTELQSGSSLLKETETETEQERENIAAGLQIVITGVLGIISLMILLIYRDFFEMSVAGAGIVSQLRDFVSGCVGFLIGGTTGKNSSR